MPPSQATSPPLAIGGIGGSGTRVVAGIIAKLGYYLGADLNEADDNQAFTLFFKRLDLWPPERHSSEIARAWAAFENCMTARNPWAAEDKDYLHSLAVSPRPNLPVDWLAWRVKVLIDQQPAEPPALWGWKEPNTHIVLPQLLELVPDLRYIHVIRHGLDMAFSSNQEQLIYWGEQLLGETSLGQTPENSFRYWCAAHRRILKIGQSMGGNFLLLNFDQFCDKPEQQVQRILSFMHFDANKSEVDDLIHSVSKPVSKGRHKSEDCSFLEAADRELLLQLGFPNTGVFKL
jgi:hypothetical protein